MILLSCDKRELAEAVHDGTKSLRMLEIRKMNKIKTRIVRPHTTREIWLVCGCARCVFWMHLTL